MISLLYDIIVNQNINAFIRIRAEQPTPNPKAENRIQSFDKRGACASSQGTGEIDREQDTKTSDSQRQNKSSRPRRATDVIVKSIFTAPKRLRDLVKPASSSLIG